MGHPATASNEHADTAQGPREFSAFLRLRQGGAARATWLLTEAPGGTMISVGADSVCDWQIRAAFVPARAFSILVVGGRAFVRSGPEPGLLVNGKPVDDGWNPLPNHARIDIGLARLEVQTGYADLMGEEPVIELSHRRQERAQRPDAGAVNQPDAVAQDAVAQTAVVQRQETRRVQSSRRRRKKTMETQEYGGHMPSRHEVAVGEPLVTPPSADKPAGKIRNSTIELNFDDLDYVGTIPMPGRGDRSGEYAMSPSLLESDEVTRVTHGGSRGLKYVMAGMLFASAYGAWIYLLDRL
jgi:hypothetical protein